VAAALGVSNMELSCTEKFRLSWKSPLVAVLTLLFASPSFYIWPNIKLIVIQYFFSLAMLLIPTIQINKYGITLYYLNKLSWAEIVEARHISFLGLPYLLIKKPKRLSVWVPLYFMGNRPITTALLAHAPVGNPIHAQLQPAHT